MKKYLIKNQKGFVLIAALTIMTLLLALGGAALTMSQLGYTSISAEKKYQLANWAAEFGLMKAIDDIVTGTVSTNKCPTTVQTGTIGSGASQSTFEYFGIRIPNTADFDYCHIKAKGIKSTSAVYKSVIVPSKGSDWGAMVTKGGTINLGGSGAIAGCDDDEGSCNNRCGVLPAVITAPNALTYTGTNPSTALSCGSEGSLKGLVGNPPKLDDPRLASTNYDFVEKYLGTSLKTSTGVDLPNINHFLEVPNKTTLTSWEKFLYGITHSRDLPGIYPTICGLFSNTTGAGNTTSYCHSGTTLYSSQATVFPNLGAIHSYIQKIIDGTGGSPWQEGATNLAASNGACNVIVTSAGNFTVTIGNTNATITKSVGTFDTTAQTGLSSLDIPFNACGKTINPIRINFQNVAAGNSINVTIDYNTEFNDGQRHILIDHTNAGGTLNLPTINLTITQTPQVPTCADFATNWGSNLFLSFRKTLNSITASHIPTGQPRQRAPHIIVANNASTAPGIHSQVPPYSNVAINAQQINTANLERIHLITSGNIYFSTSTNMDIRNSKFVSGGDIALGEPGTNTRWQKYLTDTDFFARNLYFNLTSQVEVRGGVFYSYNDMVFDTQGSLNFGTGPNNSTNFCPSGGVPSYTDPNGKPVLIIAGDPRSPKTGGTSLSMPGNLTLNGMIFTNASNVSITGSVAIQGTIINIYPTTTINNTGNSVIQFSKIILDRLSQNLSICGLKLANEPKCGAGNKGGFIVNTKVTLY